MAEQKETFVSPDQSVEQAFEQILRTNLVTTREWEPVVLAGEDPEGIHQMRVCLRRMRSALAVFRPAIPRKITRSFFKEMRWAAKTLDRARDLDVYIAENLSSKGKKRRGKMRKLAMKHRERAYDQAADFIQGERYRKICDEFRHWVETQGWRVDRSDEQREVLEGNVIPFASEVLDRQRTRVLDDGRDIESLESEALHRLRIDCKKLRYGAEFFAPLYGEPMQGFVGHLKALQDLLGTLHDTAVMPDLQKDLLKGKKNRSLTRYARRLVNERGKQAKAIRKALNKSWGGFSNAERPWMDAGAHLA
ncbi:MAG: CHAD domain-containing protein [Pseudomonadota bacterium]|nr:CHAD domain-containing protein [Pseudomonadota bacterium]